MELLLEKITKRKMFCRCGKGLKNKETHKEYRLKKYFENRKTCLLFNIINMKNFGSG